MNKITIHNLKDVPRSEIPKEGQKAYDLYLLTIEHFGEPDQWEHDEEVTSRITAVYKLIDYLNKQREKEGKKNTTTKQAEKSEATAKKAKRKSAKPQRGRPKSKEKNTTKKKTSSARQVPVIDPQISILRSFYLMLDKDIPRKRVLSLYKKIEKLATEKVIRKKDKYAKEIERISEILADAYNQGGDPVYISLKPEDKQKLKEIAYSQKVNPAVRIIKSFLTFLLNPNGDKAEKIISKIDKAIAEKQVKGEDKDKLLRIRKWTEDYIDGKEIDLEPSQLQGLLVEKKK